MPKRVQKLHLVGFTTDQKGLILSARRGARSGGFHLTVDEDLAAAVEDLRAQQAEAEAAAMEEQAEPPAPRVESALSVREIQARLRQGRTVSEVAKAAGVDPTWVERFAVPVFAEQAQVIDRVRRATLHRPRLGPSARPVGEAVRQHLAERGLTRSPAEEAEGWTTRQMADGRWVVRYRYRYRGKDRILRFELATSGDITAADRSSAQLGYVTPVAPAPERPRATGPTTAGPTTAKRATVATGFRPDADGARPTSRPAMERERATVAMRKAAAKAAVESERAAARKVRQRAAAEAKAARDAERSAAKAEREREAAARAKAAAAAKKKAAKQRADAERARKQAAKRVAAEKKREAERAKREAAKRAAAQARRAEAALVAAERAEAARRKADEARAKKAAGKKRPVQKAAKKGAAKKRPVQKAAKKGAAKKRPAKRTAASTPPMPSTQAAPAASPGVAAPPADASVSRALPVVVREEVERAEPRPRFRPGQAELAGDPRPLDRPRRTRPLRAT